MHNNKFNGCVSRAIRAGLIACVMALAAPAFAHHSAAMFDAKKDLPLSGTVKEFQFTNPHCFIQLLVPNKDGSGTTEWSIEMAAPAHVVRTGWRRDTIKPGQKITVTIHPAKDGSTTGSFVSATNANGDPL